MNKLLVHDNGDILCSFSLVMCDDHIVQFAAIPVTSKLEAWKGVPWLDQWIIPPIEKRVKYVVEARKYGVEKDLFLDIFDSWYNKLPKKAGKRINPLAINWPKMRGILSEFFGPESFDYYFNSQYRDIQSTALFINDRLDAQAKERPFPKYNLSWLTNRLGIETEKKTIDALYDANLQIQCYQRMTYFYTGELNELT